jgi:hypothetical protein
VPAEVWPAPETVDAVPETVDAVSYRWSHRKLLADIFVPDRALCEEDSTGPEESMTELRDPILGVRAAGGAEGHLGGIVLPTSRPFFQHLPGLALAVELALNHRCSLIVICSRAAKVNDFPTVFREKLGEMLTLIDLADVHPDWLPSLESSAHSVSRLHRSNDVGSKRNVGLAAAVSRRWEFMLLVDDDIATAESGPTLNSGYLSHAISAMQRDPSLKATGWTLEDYDDNSVVGHARPLVDLPQGIFIGGGALLVRCDCDVSFFPDIYNEDWLFLIALAMAAGTQENQKPLGWGGRVHQRAYAPFRTRRAQSEEAGEVIGECLMNLLEDHGPNYETLMTPSYWRRALQSRWCLLEEIKKAAVKQAESRFETVGPRTRQRLVEAMSAAQAVHRELRPMELLDFVRAWRGDERAWRRHLSRLVAESPSDAAGPALVRSLSSSPFPPPREPPGLVIPSRTGHHEEPAERARWLGSTGELLQGASEDRIARC